MLRYCLTACGTFDESTAAGSVAVLVAKGFFGRTGTAVARAVVQGRVLRATISTDAGEVTLWDGPQFRHLQRGNVARISRN